MGRNFYAKTLHAPGLLKQGNSMKDQKPSLAGPCGVERDTERKHLIYEQSEMVPIPLTFVTFYKTLSSFFICCVWFLLCETNQ